MPRNHRHRRNKKHQKNKHRNRSNHGKSRNGSPKSPQHHRHKDENQNRQKSQSPKKTKISPIKVPETDRCDDVDGKEAHDIPSNDISLNDIPPNDIIPSDSNHRIQRRDTNDSKEVASPSIKSTSRSHTMHHSPLNIHYEADDDDVSDTHHLSPLLHPGITPDPQDSHHDPPSLSSSYSNHKKGENEVHDVHPIPFNLSNGSTKMQILRSAKISHRNEQIPRSRSTDSSDDSHGHSHGNSHNHNGSRSVFTAAFSALNRITRSHSDPVHPNTMSSTKSLISPGFTSSPQLLAQHHQYPHLPPISPLPGFRRGSTDSIVSPSISPVRSPGKSILYGSPTRSAPSRSASPSVSSHSHSGPGGAHHIRFGAVEVHEFKLTAGSESDGVPEDGGFSLTLDRKEVHNATVDLEEYERQRYSRWTKRAQHLHWTKNRISEVMDNPERYLFTAGRCDEFYSYLTPKEREERLESDNGSEWTQWKQQHSKDLDAERAELERLRKSRESNIFCECKPLGKMSTEELKAVAERHHIKINKKKKVKKGFLINMIKSKVLNHQDVCCWDEEGCSCRKGGIECHSGVNDMKCGCVHFQKKCVNPEGRYMFKNPRYAGHVITEWKEHYEFAGDDEEVEAGKVSFGV